MSREFPVQFESANPSTPAPEHPALVVARSNSRIQTFVHGFWWRNDLPGDSLRALSAVAKNFEVITNDPQPMPFPAKLREGVIERAKEAFSNTNDGANKIRAQAFWLDRVAPVAGIGFGEVCSDDIGRVSLEELELMASEVADFDDQFRITKRLGLVDKKNDQVVLDGPLRGLFVNRIIDLVEKLPANDPLRERYKNISHWQALDSQAPAFAQARLGELVTTQGRRDHDYRLGDKVYSLDRNYIVIDFTPEGGLVGRSNFLMAIDRVLTPNAVTLRNPNKWRRFESLAVDDRVILRDGSRGVVVGSNLEPDSSRRPEYYLIRDGDGNERQVMVFEVDHAARMSFDSLDREVQRTAARQELDTAEEYLWKTVGGREHQSPGRALTESELDTLGRGFGLDLEVVGWNDLRRPDKEGRIQELIGKYTQASRSEGIHGFFYEPRKPDFPIWEAIVAADFARRRVTTPLIKLEERYQQATEPYRSGQAYVTAVRGKGIVVIPLSSYSGKEIVLGKIAGVEPKGNSQKALDQALIDMVVGRLRELYKFSPPEALARETKWREAFKRDLGIDLPSVGVRAPGFSWLVSKDVRGMAQLIGAAANPSQLQAALGLLHNLKGKIKTNEFNSLLVFAKARAAEVPFEQQTPSPDVEKIFRDAEELNETTPPGLGRARRVGFMFLEHTPGVSYEDMGVIGRVIYYFGRLSALPADQRDQFNQSFQQQWSLNAEEASLSWPTFIQRVAGGLGETFSSLSIDASRKAITNISRFASLSIAQEISKVVHSYTMAKARVISQQSIEQTGRNLVGSEIEDQTRDTLARGVVYFARLVASEDPEQFHREFKDQFQTPSETAMSVPDFFKAFARQLGNAYADLPEDLQQRVVRFGGIGKQIARVGEHFIKVRERIAARDDLVDLADIFESVQTNDPTTLKALLVQRWSPEWGDISDADLVVQLREIINQNWQILVEATNPIIPPEQLARIRAVLKPDEQALSETR